MGCGNDVDDFDVILVYVPALRCLLRLLHQFQQVDRQLTDETTYRYLVFAGNGRGSGIAQTSNFPATRAIADTHMKRIIHTELAK